MSQRTTMPGVAMCAQTMRRICNGLSQLGIHKTFRPRACTRSIPYSLSKVALPTSDSGDFRFVSSALSLFIALLGQETRMAPSHHLGHRAIHSHTQRAQAKLGSLPNARASHPTRYGHLKRRRSCSDTGQEPLSTPPKVVPTPLTLAYRTPLG